MTHTEGVGYFPSMKRLCKVIMSIPLFSCSDCQCQEQDCDGQGTQRDVEEILQTHGAGADQSWGEEATGGHLVCQPEAASMLEDNLRPHAKHVQRSAIRTLRRRYFLLGLVNRASVIIYRGEKTASLMSACLLQGFRYKMRAVYAHFPINMTMNDDGTVVDIRNFLGEKYTRTVHMRSGVTISATGVKDEVKLEGNDLELVSLSGTPCFLFP